MKNLTISKTLKLPLDVVTMVIAILAQRGSGKSYTASVCAEEMLEATQQIVALDPTGVWHGLRSSADGKKPGYNIFVFGGDHGDFPLDSHSGEIVAEAIIEQGFSAVLDLSLFSNGEIIRFATAFLETLYQKNREALHVFVDEADVFAPQIVRPDTARLLGAMEAGVRRGRKKGLGFTLITQRPAVLNKNVLTQADVLVAMRLSHPKDIKPIEEWAAAQADLETLEKMTATLPGLDTGTAWFWSPQALKIFEKVQIRERRTFDSGATPKPGQKIKAPKVFASVDREKLGAQLLAMVEEKKASDPGVLKRALAAAQKELAALKAKPATAPKPSKDELLAAKNEGIKVGFKQCLDRCKENEKKILKFANDIAGAFFKLSDKVKEFNEYVTEVNTPGTRLAGFDHMSAKPEIDEKKAAENAQRYRTGNASTDAQNLLTVDPHKRNFRPEDYPDVRAPQISGGGTRKIMVTLAQVYPESLDRSRLALRSQVSPTSSTTANIISKLRTTGMLEGTGDAIRLTEAGYAATRPFPPLPSGDELFAYWRNFAGGSSARIMDSLREAGALTRNEIAEKSAQSNTSSTFANNLSRLKVLGLIEKNGDSYRLAATFD